MNVLHKYQLHLGRFGSGSHKPKLVFFLEKEKEKAGRVIYFVRERDKIIQPSKCTSLLFSQVAEESHNYLLLDKIEKQPVYKYV